MTSVWQTAGLRPDDLDCVVFYEKPLLKFERILLTAVATAPRSLRYFREAMISALLDRLWVKAKLRGRFGLPSERLLFCEHHLSHAASAFYCSPFAAAAILTVDGVGEWTTAALGVGEDTTLRLTDELRFPHSLGLLYSAFTAWLGFEVNEGEYKVMGLAAYGRPKYVDQVYTGWCRLTGMAVCTWICRISPSTNRCSTPTAPSSSRCSARRAIPARSGSSNTTPTWRRVFSGSVRRRSWR